MLVEQFTQIFRDEHRQVRDTLLDLLEAFLARDRRRITALLNQTAALTGPHFRYEEESMYPALTVIFGDEYIAKLFSDHDRAIGVAKRLVELAGQETLTNQDVTEAVRLIRLLLPHVSDCDGLSIMVERLPEAQVQQILNTRDFTGQAGLNLLAWADQVRSRPAIMPNRA
ncbi:MAG: hemerythrin domain-containing protein [Anaerolineales bacterium]|nr:hemerythrin domain-containing protein [Anaerolineales bacterium]